MGSEPDSSLYSKYGLLAAFFFAVSFLFPLLEVRPNRITDGDEITLVGLPLLSLFLLALVLLLLVLMVLPLPRNFKKSVSMVLPVLGLSALVFILAQIGIRVAPALTSAARITPGLSLLTLVLACVLPLFSFRASKVYLVVLGLVVVSAILLAATMGAWEHLGFYREFLNRQERFFQEVGTHIFLALFGVSLAALLGIPMAFILHKSKALKRILLPILNVIQTIPSLALFGLMLVPLSLLSQSFPLLREWGIRGIGNTPAILALALYGLFPVVRNTLVALDEVSPGALEAARGMGMSPRQIWIGIRLPLASPVILGGIRLALVQSLGNATLAKLVGAGGLGVFVFEGLGQVAADMVLLGLLGILILTLLTDQFFSWIIHWITPKPLRKGAIT